MELVNILTRTSRRPRFFAECRRSIQEQDYPRIRHLVSYDDAETGQYVAEYTSQQNFEAFQVPRIADKDRKAGDFPYNLYLNTLQEQVTEGWIMFLDDDDILVRPDAISIMMRTINNWTSTEVSDRASTVPVDTLVSDQLVMWHVRFAGNRLVPKKLGTVRLGDVSCIGFMYHSKWKSVALWGDQKGGDYRVIKQLSDHLKLLLIPEVLTAINYSAVRRGGSGMRLDKDTFAKLNSVKKPHAIEKRVHRVTVRKKNSTSKEMSENNLEQMAKRYLQTHNTTKQITLADPNFEETIGKMKDPRNKRVTFAQTQPEIVTYQRVLEEITDAHEGDHDAESKTDAIDKTEGTHEAESKTEVDHNAESKTEDEEIVESAYFIGTACDGDYEEEEETDYEAEGETEVESDHEAEGEIEEEEATDYEVESDHDAEGDHEAEVKTDDISLESLKNALMHDFKKLIRHELSQINQRLDQLTVRLDALSESTEQVRSDDRTTPVSDRPTPVSRQLVPVSDQLEALRKTREIKIAPPNRSRSRVQLTQLLKGYNDRPKIPTETPTATPIEIPEKSSKMSTKAQVIPTKATKVVKAQVTKTKESAQVDIQTDSKFAKMFVQMFAQIYIIDVGGHGTLLQKKLTDLGLESKVINIKSKSGSLLDYLPEVADQSGKKGLESVMVLLDSAQVHGDLLREMAHQWKTLQERDWKILLFGASHNLIRSPLDWQYYLSDSAYGAELRKHNINTEQLAARHWKYYGQKEGRFGARHADIPFQTKGLCGVALKAAVFEDIVRSSKLSSLLSGALKQKTLAVSPLWFLTDNGKTNKARNKFNLHLYESVEVEPTS